jgi:predicted  nucleic acid-binding Zn-ribbon protein
METDLITLGLETKTTAGTITTNARLLLEQVKAGVARYKSDDYEPDEKTAKADRAALNSFARRVDEERKNIEAAYNAPLREFLLTCKEIKDTVGEAVEIIAGAVNAYEDKRKRRKRELVEKIFLSKKFDIVPLDRIFDPRWLNKTYAIETVESDIDGVIGRVLSDIKTLEGLTEYAVIAKSKYLDTLDLGAALAEARRLEENAKKLAKEKAERAGREAAAAAEEAERELADMEEKAAAVPPAPAKSLMDMSDWEPEKKKTYTYTFTFTATAEKCRALRQYMLENKIEYEKVDLSLYNKTDF